MSDSFKPHLFSYSADGARWSLKIEATDEADARRRLSLASMGHFDGIVHMTIPAYPGVGLFIRATTWLASLFREPQR